jgi:hypothetical protein
MKKLLFFLLFPILAFGQTITISVDYAGLINEPDENVTTPVTNLEIGDEFYIDITMTNSDNSQRKATYADIWFTFKNDAFEYLGVVNPLDGTNNWYTNQWPSSYIFNNSSEEGITVDDLYGQYYQGSFWSYVGDDSSDHAPMHIRTQTAGPELTGTVARLKFKYKQVANGFDFSESVFLRKAFVRDNTTDHLFTDVKAFPNQTFDNVPPSTTVTAQFKVLFPETLDASLFDGGLYTPDPNEENTWVQPVGALYDNLSSTGTLDITQGFNRTDDFSVVINWDGYVVSREEGVEDYVISFKEQYDEIVTVSDVVLAFKELANRGINMDETGNEFGYGVQFMNADVNGDGTFDDQDTYLMLAHVLDSDNNNLLGQDQYMVMASKFYSKADWDAITPENYSEYPNGTTLMNDLDNKDNSKLQFFYESAITWKGDVNLSHSTTPPVAQAATTARAFARPQAVRFAPNPDLVTVSSGLVTELKDGKVYATVTLDPGVQDVVGTQYKLSFDNSKVEFESINFETANTATNFASNKTDYIKFGSLIQSGDEVLLDSTKYTLIFTPKQQFSNTLGLIVISNTDAVNKEGIQLNLEIK